MRGLKENVVIGYSDTARHYFDIGKALIYYFYEDVDYPPDDFDIEEILKDNILLSIGRIKQGQCQSDEDDPLEQAALGFISKMEQDGISDWVFDIEYDCVSIDIDRDGVYQLILRENPDYATQ